MANFSGGRFSCPTSFYGATFGGEALFQGVRFGDHGITNFSGCTFRRRAIFYRAHFEAETEFESARFESEAVFRAWFTKRVSFAMSRFLGSSEFSDSKVVVWSPDEASWADGDGWLPGSRLGEASFVQARFAGDARFDSVKFDGPLDLREATFVTLYLPSDTDERAEGNLLPPRIGLVGCRYDRVALRHPLNLLLLHRTALRLWGAYDRQPFAQLADTLRRSGDERAGDRVYLAGRILEHRQMPLVSRLIDGCYRVFANYGVKPWRLAGLSAVLILAGGWFFSHPGTLEPKDREKRGVGSYASTRAEALTMGLAQFLPVSLPIKDQLVPTHQLVPIGLPGPWAGSRDVIALRPTSVAGTLQLLGWILVPVGVAGATGVLMRKTK